MHQACRVSVLVAVDMFVYGCNSNAAVVVVVVVVVIVFNSSMMHGVFPSHDGNSGICHNQYTHKKGAME